MANQPKDAAERVQEGNVANWMDYYKRERGFAPEDPQQEKPTAGDRREIPAPAAVPRINEQVPVR
jgi:hypothetical protein